MIRKKVEAEVLNLYKRVNPSYKEGFDKNGFFLEWFQQTKENWIHHLKIPRGKKVKVVFATNVITRQESLKRIGSRKRGRFSFSNPLRWRFYRCWSKTVTRLIRPNSGHQVEITKKLILNLFQKSRPFASSILEEYSKEYFENSYHVPFAQKIYPVKKEKRKIIPSVTHVDGSGRLQTVSKKTNLLF